MSTKKIPPKSTLHVARDFLKRVPGAMLFPIKAGEKAPPLLDGNLALASNEPKRLAHWHANYPGCNWGLANKKSKLIVLDVDMKVGKVGDQTLDTLVMTYGELPDTLTIQTPSGGRHYVFKEANGVVHRHRLGEYGFGKDIDSTNYVVIAGCALNVGGAYTIINDAPIADAPAWFGLFLKETDTTKSTDQTPVVELDQPANVQWAIHYLTHDAPPSIQGRNGEFALLMVAGALKDHGISKTKAIELLNEHYNVFGKCEPLWSVGEGQSADRLESKVENAYGYLKQNAPGSRTAAADFAGDPVTSAELAATAALWSARKAYCVIDGRLYPVVKPRHHNRKKKK